MGAPRPGIVIGHFRGRREIVVLLQGRAFFSDAESDACREACRQAIEAGGDDMDRMGVLVFTDGGGPSGAQRADLRAFLGGRTMRIAVLSSSRLVRGIVAAIGWWNAEIRSFAPRDLGRAVAYLDVTPEETPALWAEVERLDVAMGLDVVADLRAVKVRARP